MELESVRWYLVVDRLNPASESDVYMTKSQSFITTLKTSVTSVQMDVTSVKTSVNLGQQISRNVSAKSVL